MTLDPTAIVKTVADIASPISASLTDAWAAVLGDRIAVWRVKNAAKLQKSVNTEMKALGVALDRARIPERYAFAWFEEATQQDEQEIHELFAKLLARAAAGDPDASDRRHIITISRFTPIDSCVLKLIYERAPQRRQSDISGRPLQGATYREGSLYDIVAKEFGEEARQSIEHLIVLGVLEVRPELDSWALQRLFQSATVDDRGELDLPHYSADLSIDAEVRMTITGQSLCRALGMAL